MPRLVPTLAVEGLNHRMQNHSFFRQEPDASLDFEAIFAQKHFLETLIHSMHHALIAINRDGVITNFSKRAEMMLGYSAEEIINFATPVLFHDPEEIRSRAEQLSVELGIPVAPGLPVFTVLSDLGLQNEKEWTYIRKDGSRLIVELSITPLKSAKDETIGYIGIANDVTEKSQLRKSLETETKKLKALLENAGDSIHILDQDGNVVICSDSFAKTLGYTKSEAEKMNVMDWDVAIPKSEVVQKVRELIQRPQTFLTRHRRKNGQIIDMEVTATGVELEGNHYLFASARDITDRLANENIILDQNRIQQVVNELSSDFVKANQGNLDHLMNHFLKRLGRFFQVDRSYFFVFSEDLTTVTNTHEWYREGISSEIENLQNFSISEIAWWKDKILSNTAVLISDVSLLPDEASIEKNEWVRQGIQTLLLIPVVRDGKRIGFFGFDSVNSIRIWKDYQIDHLLTLAHTIADALIKVDIERALIEQKNKAELASRAKSEFLANMSHEIRTPLNAVIGFTDLLKSTPLNPLQEEYVRNANSSGRILLEIINDILDFSKIEAGMMVLDQTRTDLHNLLETIVEIIRYEADKKKVQVLLTVDLHSTPRYIFIDALRLKQILANLLGNAVKFTHEGEIELSVSFKDQGLNRGIFRFSVRDTGIGIHPNEKAKLFQAFSQADTSTTRKFGGTGLGLAISQMIAQKMNSSIHLESFPGEGSVFSFDLSATFDIENDNLHSIKTFHPLPIPKPSQYWKIIPKKSNPKILIVEDNQLNLILIQAMVRKNLPTSEIQNAPNGLEAIRICQDFRPDIIFMDIQMPEMDGIEATRKIRDWEQTFDSHIPIIALTAGVLPEEKKICFDVGMDGFLAKPLDQTHLRAILETHLS